MSATKNKNWMFDTPKPITKEIFINGMIDENTFELIQSLKGCDECVINIDSFGGYVYQGIQCYAFLKQLAAEGMVIKTVGWSMVYSAATLIFVTGQEREIMPFNEFLIHMPMSGKIEGYNEKELETYLQDLRKDKAQILNIYKNETGLSDEVLSGMMEEDRVWKAMETLQNGFATNIRSNTNTLKGGNTNTLKSNFSKSVTMWRHEHINKKTDKKEMAYVSYMDTSLGYSRDKMPQITDKFRDIFFAYFKAKYGDKSVMTGNTEISNLKPSQSEIDDNKVQNIINDKSFIGNKYIVSNDFHLLDGHHNWAAQLEMNPTRKVDFIKIDLPFNELVNEANSLKITFNEANEGKVNKNTNLEQLQFLYFIS